jgi:hypothetical protein
MSKHTPGPWHCHEVVGVYAKDGKLVASVHTPISDRSHDARLIAAAPELLSVCKELAASAAYWSDYDVPVGIVDRLRAAIAKAEGSA